MFYFKLVILMTLFINNNVVFVRARECIIENKAYPNEYLYQNSKNTKNEMVNGFLKRVDRIQDLDSIKWIIRLHSNNRITLQNKKTNEYLCAMPPLFNNRFNHVHSSISLVKSMNLNCVWIEKRSTDDETKSTFLLWNSFYSRQLFGNLKSSKKNERSIQLAQEKTKLNNKNNFKWIIKCQ